MKIVDSFLFSEPYEKELLLLKLILEADGVDEWILIENAYTFQGDYKGLFANEILNNDARFKPFLHKIKVLSSETEFSKLPKNEVLDDEAFKVEFWQRDLAHQYFIDNYDDEDWIIISDADESLDFTEPLRKNELTDRMKNAAEGILHVSTKRYWFDFDNEYKPLYGIPMCTKKYLQTNNQKLHHVRVAYHADLKMKWNNIIGFEYSSCFNINEILRKLSTYSHMAVKVEELQQALRCNHRPVLKIRNMKIKNNQRFFFEKIILTPENSPKYVRDNIEKLRTGNINPNYKENRKIDYPHLFTIQYKLSEFSNSIFLKTTMYLRQFFRILKLEKFIYE